MVRRTVGTAMLGNILRAPVLIRILEGAVFWRILRSYRGEGNGNPLQYSCLENPMAGGAW